MRLGLEEALAGRKRKIAVCPSCGSERARHSRRYYDGPWFLLFRVRPIKCSDCGLYFPIAANGSLRRAVVDLGDLGIPFRPSELDSSPEGPGEPASPPLPDKLPRKRGLCPNCGSNAARALRPGTSGTLLRLFDAKDEYRCHECNASFRRISLVRLVLVALFLFTVLAGLSYIGLATLGRSKASTAPPGIRKDKVPQPSPPVFR